MKTAYFTQRQYARRLGVSHTAVQKAIKSGRIKLNEHGYIDVVQADLDWMHNTDLRYMRMPLKAIKVIRETVNVLWAEETGKEFKKTMKDIGNADEELEALFDDDDF